MICLLLGGGGGGGGGGRRGVHTSISKETKYMCSHL